MGEHQLNRAELKALGWSDDSLDFIEAIARGDHLKDGNFLRSAEPLVPKAQPTPEQGREDEREQLAQILFNDTFGGTSDPTLTEMAEAIAYSQADAILTAGFRLQPKLDREALAREISHAFAGLDLGRVSCDGATFQPNDDVIDGACNVAAAAILALIGRG